MNKYDATPKVIGIVSAVQVITIIVSLIERNLVHKIIPSNNIAKLVSIGLSLLDALADASVKRLNPKIITFESSSNESSVLRLFSKDFEISTISSVSKSDVEIARLSGTSGFSIMFKEMLPNLAPYIGASLVGSVASAILASVGLEALGLGPFDSPTLGMTIYWNIQFSSILHGMWWWFGPPIIVLAMIFVGLFLMTAGLDEWSNPRLRKRV